MVGFAYCKPADALVLFLFALHNSNQGRIQDLLVGVFVYQDNKHAITEGGNSISKAWNMPHVENLVRNRARGLVKDTFSIPNEAVFQKKRLR